MSKVGRRCVVYLVRSDVISLEDLFLRRSGSVTLRSIDLRNNTVVQTAMLLHSRYNNCLHFLQVTDR